MDTEILAKICDFYVAGRFLRATSIKKKGFIHNVLQVHTTQNIYLLKQYAFSEKKQLQIIKKLIKKFSEAEISCATPLMHSTKLFYHEGNNLWLMFPWVTGKRLELKEISPAHIKIIAKILGKIHRLQLRIINVKPALANKLNRLRLENIVGVKNKQLIKSSIRKFSLARQLIQHDQVISHGDLFPANVIWRTANKPVLIDWDHCGKINQEIDLFNTAINWSGIEASRIDINKYKLFLANYSKTNPRQIFITRKIIHASYGSWLNWIAYVWKNLSKDMAQRQQTIAINALAYLNRYEKLLLTSSC
jgi:Ser/Thr protein kinase RdoA (MazF antagonist)